MDEYDRRQAEREKRNAATVAELSAVCAQHGARAYYLPAEGVLVVVDTGRARVECRWSFSARSWRTEVQSPTGGTHVADHADVARAMAQASALLADGAFDTALAIVLSRTSDDSARAILAARQRREAAQQSYVSRHGG